MRIVIETFEREEGGFLAVATSFGDCPVGKIGYGATERIAALNAAGKAFPLPEAPEPVQQPTVAAPEVAVTDRDIERLLRENVGRTVELEYLDPNGKPTIRDFIPIRVDQGASAYSYVGGRTEDGWRTFRIDRIVQVTA